MAAHEWRITDVADLHEDHEYAWVITYERIAPEPGTFVSYIPKQAIEQVAAEYGLTSTQEVLGVLLYEPFLAWQQTQPGFSPRLLDAETARIRIGEQIAACKRGHLVTNLEQSATDRRSAEPDPLQVIHDHTRVDPVRTAALRLEIDRARLTRAATP